MVEDVVVVNRFEWDEKEYEEDDDMIFYSRSVCCSKRTTTLEGLV